MWLGIFLNGSTEQGQICLFKKDLQSESKIQNQSCIGFYTDELIIGICTFSVQLLIR